MEKKYFKIIKRKKIAGINKWKNEKKIGNASKGRKLSDNTKKNIFKKHRKKSNSWNKKKTLFISHVLNNLRKQN